MQGTHWWLVCYDVRDAKRLRKAAKHMEGYGERMQYSVFRCWLNPRSMEELRWELTELLTAEDDVLFIPLCSDCVSGMRTTHGGAQGPCWPPEPEGHRIV
jgi:CRISPR-associated protein Cas2